MKFRRFELALLIFAAAAVLFTAGFLIGRHTARVRIYVTGSSAAQSERCPVTEPSAAALRTERGFIRAVSEQPHIRNNRKKACCTPVFLVTADISAPPGGAPTFLSGGRSRENTGR